MVVVYCVNFGNSWNPKMRKEKENDCIGTHNYWIQSDACRGSCLQLCVYFRGMVLMFWQSFYCEIWHPAHYHKRCSLAVMPGLLCACWFPALPQHQHRSNAVSVLSLFLVRSLRKSPNSSVQLILDETAGRWVLWVFACCASTLTQRLCLFTRIPLFIQLLLLDLEFLLMLRNKMWLWFQRLCY